MKWQPDPKVHTTKVIEYLQEAGCTGPVQHWVIANYYPLFAGKAGLKPLHIHDVLGAVGKLTKKSRRKMEDEAGDLDRVMCYIIPEPEEAAVVPMRREQAA